MFFTAEEKGIKLGERYMQLLFFMSNGSQKVSLPNDTIAGREKNSHFEKNRFPE